jgi:hypothetical protein
MENFTAELLGDVLLSSYLAWMLLAVIGAFTATLIRNHLTSLKSYPVNPVQILTGLLLTFIFIRFSLELTGLTPNAFGAFAIGLGGNELALSFLKRFLNKDNGEKKIQAFADEEDGDGAGTPNKAP